ncbi:MAG TPA: hypothetical protein PLZ36_08210 [Armatimonadota bacterium]|nr:hypothetical protein [Armatimonadota bacterium]
MMAITIDHNANNADWSKRTWDLPAYKSPEFMALVGGDAGLPHFRTLPVYRFAVQRGLIADDEWAGSDEDAV